MLGGWSRWRVAKLLARNDITMLRLNDANKRAVFLSEICDKLPQFFDSVKLRGGGDE